MVLSAGLFHKRLVENPVREMNLPVSENRIANVDNISYADATFYNDPRKWEKTPRRSGQDRCNSISYSNRLLAKPNPTHTRPPGEDCYLTCASSEAFVDGFWTYSKCSTGSLLAINRWLRSFGPARLRVPIYQGKEEIGRVLTELRRQTTLHRLLKAGQPNN
jgi:hypothetical protein